ncbi:MAG: pyruvate kinase, partial [Hydrogenoanaerobacterium sp.]
MRKTKIICTLGPATETKEKIKELILAGMNVARFNFSHGTHDEHLKKLEILRELREEMQLPIASLLDTKGPEIRLGKFKDGGAELKTGDIFTITTAECEGTAQKATISFKGLPADVDAGSRILLDDGLIELKVINVENECEIACKVINGGHISNNKGVNVPGVKLSLPFVSERDYDDILWGIEQGFDFIAASFTRTADDILEIRKILETKDCHAVRIIAKIENAEGVANIDDILHVSDGVMIARGDMGVEIPLEEVPVVQKLLIKKAYSAGKQV